MILEPVGSPNRRNDESLPAGSSCARRAGWTTRGQARQPGYHCWLPCSVCPCPNRRAAAARGVVPTMSHRSRSFVLLATLLAADVSCSRGQNGAGPGGGPGGPGGGMPAMGVEVVTLAPKPVEQVTEFVGTVKSRRSTTIQPQAEGFITRIAVRSGDRVRAGQALLSIDSAGQQASVAALESQRASRQADLQFARQQLQRQKTLLEAGRVQPVGVRTGADGGARPPRRRCTRSSQQIRQQQRAARVSHGDRAGGRHHRRHPGAHRRQRHQVDRAHHRRRQRRPRALPARCRCRRRPT